MTPDPRDGDPLRPPDPEPAPVDPIRHWIPSAAENPGCGTLLAIIGSVVLAILVAAPRPSPQPSPVETTAGAPLSGPWGDGPRVSTGSVSRGLERMPSGAPPTPSMQTFHVPAMPSPGAIEGFATWCGPTPTQCQGWGGDAMLGAVPGFRYGDEPYRVTVSREGREPVTVLVVSFCACGDRHGVPTLIDLSPAAFEQLGPLSRGVIRVEVEGVP